MTSLDVTLGLGEKMSNVRLRLIWQPMRWHDLVNGRKCNKVTILRAYADTDSLHSQRYNQGCRGCELHVSITAGYGLYCFSSHARA